VALLNIDSALKLAMERLSRLTPPQGIEILSYKRNRGVSLLLKDNSTIHIRERGYVEEDLFVSMPDVRKQLKKIIKREFPRSRKVRVYQLSGPDELGGERKKL
jgi:hypothetical protein